MHLRCQAAQPNASVRKCTTATRVRNLRAEIWQFAVPGFSKCEKSSAPAVL
jgi:hypothetical protein